MEKISTDSNQDVDRKVQDINDAAESEIMQIQEELKYETSFLHDDRKIIIEALRNGAQCQKQNEAEHLDIDLPEEIKVITEEIQNATYFV